MSKLKLHLKKGALSRQLGIPESKNIPLYLLYDLKKSDVGKKVNYKGKKITVTKLLKKRVNFAINSKKWSRK